MRIIDRRPNESLEDYRQRLLDRINLLGLVSTGSERLSLKIREVDREIHNNRLAQERERSFAPP